MEALGRLFKNSVKLYIYPMRTDAYNRYCQADTTSSPTPGLGNSEHPLAIDVWINATNLQVKLHLRNLMSTFLRITTWFRWSDLIPRSRRYCPRISLRKSRPENPDGREWFPKRHRQLLRNDICSVTEAESRTAADNPACGSPQVSARKSPRNIIAAISSIGPPPVL